MRKRDDGKKKQLESPVDGGSGPSREDVEDKAEGGGDRGNEDEEEDCQRLKLTLSVNRAHGGARSAQGLDDYDPEEQGDIDEQQDRLSSLRLSL